MWRRFRSLSLIAVAVGAFAPAAFSQSCSLCYTQAASATAQFIQALRSGILILIIPPALMWTAMLITVYRRRNKFRQDPVEKGYSGW
jgi:hypothetical protein